jgi:hypothetical protein
VVSVVFGEVAEDAVVSVVFDLTPVASVVGSLCPPSKASGIVIPSIQTESYKRHMRTRKMVRKDVRDIFILFCIAKKGRRIDCCTALFRGAKSEKNVGKK